MATHRRTVPLRLRITLLNLFVFAGNLVALGLVILQARHYDLVSESDERLSERAEAMMTVIRAAAQPGQSPSDLVRTSSVITQTVYVQLRDESGAVLESSPNLRGRTLPLTETALAASGDEPALETIEGEEAALLGMGDVRLLTMAVNWADGSVRYLQLATSLAPVQETMARVRGILLAVLILGLVVGGLSSWWLAGAWLRPLKAMARDARELSAAKLDQRLSPGPNDELGELARVINKMLDRLQAAFAAQERFMANVSHELKTPLSVLLGEAQTLTEKGPTPEECQRFAASASEEIRRMTATVDGLLNLARAQAGAPLRTDSVTSVNELIVEVTRQLSHLANQRHVRLVPELVVNENGALELNVLGDGTLLQAALSNLVRNAIRASPPDQPVEIRAWPFGPWVSIAVCDHGPGIPSSRREEIFEPFHQLDGDDSPASGVGLGLAIAKGIIERSQGTLRLGDASDGCEFIVQLTAALGEMKDP